MPDDLIGELLLRWDDLREQGQAVSAEELCRDYPELVDEVRQRIQMLEAVYQIPNGVDLQAATLPAAPPSDLPLPELPGFEILGCLGSGGMGVVYKARQTRLKRLVALKMIRAGAHATASELARFRTEAEAVAQLQHPNIVQIYEIGEHAGRPYLALEYVDGGSLTQFLNGKPLPEREAARLVQQLADAVHFAHQRGIIHRDLKPANVLLQGEGTSRQGAKAPKEDTSLVPSFGALAPWRELFFQPKITDFGLAKRLGADTGQTQTGAVLGTPSYMAPEQAEGRVHEIGPATDIYALGAILYELLTGLPPFQGNTLLQTLEQVRTQDPVRPSTFQPGVARDLETICLKCLHKNRADRYATAQELADDLGRFLAGEPIRARSLNLVDHLTRTLNRSRDVSEFRPLSTVVLYLAALPFLVQVVLWYLAPRGGWYGWAAMLAVPGTVAAIAILLLATVGTAFLGRASTTNREIWSIRLGILTGLILLPVVSFLTSPADRPWDPLTVFPLWSVLVGSAFFSLGGMIWGRLYLNALAIYAAAVVMALALDWAPLLFGAVLSATLAGLGLHLRQQHP